MSSGKKTKIVALLAVFYLIFQWSYLMANQDSGLIKELNDDNFTQIISSGVTLVDFSAEWCGPCRMLAPILETVAKAVQGKALVAKVDVDQAQKVSASFSITSVPTLILFKNGKEVSRTVGLKDEAALEHFITSAL